MLLNPTLLITAGIMGTLILMLVTTVFIVAQLRADNSVMDIAYGPIFLLSYWITWWIIGMPSGLPLLVGCLVSVWGIRLGLRIGRKNWGAPEDARYAVWRKAWRERGHLYFLLRSYIQINLLQGSIIMVVSAPLWWVLAQPTAPTPWLLTLGVLVVLLGVVYETAADWQLDSFIARKKAGLTAHPLMESGLFRYSRRPNYFGEALVWWGFAGIALSTSWAAWPVLVGPLLITVILTRVTGPMLESHFLKQYPEAYRAYMRRTNYFIPGPPRDVAK